MNIFKRMLCVAGVALSVTFAHAEIVDPSLAPDQLVEAVSNNVIDEIRKDPELAKAEPSHVRVLVDKHILPYTDFARMTKMAVGPSWRKATEEQRSEIQSLFRQLLVGVYSGALKEASDYKVVLRPNKIKPGDRQTIIRSQLVSQGREPIVLDYRVLNAGKGWKIFDVNVGGVWLVENYRSQFSSVISSSGIDGLITQLRDRVANLKSGK